MLLFEFMTVKYKDIRLLNRISQNLIGYTIKQYSVESEDVITNTTGNWPKLSAFGQNTVLTPIMIRFTNDRFGKLKGV